MGKFVFIAKSKSLQFEISGKDEIESQYFTSVVLLPFISVLDKSNCLGQINEIQKNSQILRSKINRVVDIIKDYDPKINKLSDYFVKDLNPEEFFFIGLDRDISNEELDQIMFKLSISGDDEIGIEQQFVTLNILKKIRSVYDIHTFGEFSKIPVGESVKEKRICRYCHRSIPNTTFKNVAHTISEALGNKRIKTNDECDNCNHFFGDKIEQDFISMFDFPRLLYNVKGKDGSPHKFVGDNYMMKRDDVGKIMIEYLTKEEYLENEDFINNVVLTSKRDFPEQNIYKTLSKYIFGVLDDKTLVSFEKTRKWLLEESKEYHLPKLARFCHSEATKHPHMIVYVKNNDERKDLPHVVAEIRIIIFSFIVILPFSDKDDCLYENDVDYQRFWQFFDVYSNIPNWRIGDCNELEPKQPNVVLSFKDNGNIEN